MRRGVTWNSRERQRPRSSRAPGPQG